MRIACGAETQIMATSQEKEAAKAAKLAEKEAAKAAKLSINEPKVEVLPTIDGPGIVAGIPDDKGGLRYPPEGSKANTMLRFLASLPTVRTRIPREAKEPKGAFHDVIQNGLHIFILKGAVVEVPSRIDEILAKSYFDTEKAINETVVINPFTGVVTNARVDLQSEDNKQALNA